MWLESKPGRRGRKSPHRRTLRRSPAVWCSALALAAAAPAAAAYAGSLAPQPRVIAKYERGFLDRSGSQTLDELLDSGIIRYFLTGGQPLPVLVNGRPYATTSDDLDTLPVSAIERIEVLGGESLGVLGGASLRGALNVVLRRDLDGFETRALARLPGRSGGDGWQGSAFWGGAVGEGRMTLGLDILKRQEITARSRPHSRSVWRAGGAFAQARNVSVGGNTVWVVQRNNNDETTGIRSVALGTCETERGYTGALTNPPGVTVRTDEGCGFAYGNIMWDSARYAQRGLVLNFDHPIGDKAEVKLDANVAQSDWAFRYAPSVGSFAFTPTGGLITAINDKATGWSADSNDRFAAAHRFVGHGNRDWKSKTEKYDISFGVEGRFTDGLGYDARIGAFRSKGSLSGSAFVHGQRIREAIQGCSDAPSEDRLCYDLEDPFSTDADHKRAIRYSSLREDLDFGQEYLGARLALEGNGFAIGGRNAAWTAGIGLARTEAHVRMVFRSNDGMTHDVSEVLGSGGTSYAGKRRTVAAFVETSLPLADDLDFRIAGRLDRTDDVGGLKSWRVGVEYRPFDILTLRTSWSAGQNTPSMRSLHSSAAQDHPYIECDPGSPPRPCTSANPRQVTRVTVGNPKLDPSDGTRFAIGAEARKGPYFAGVQWHRDSRSGLVGRNSADWAMRNLPECEGNDTSDCIARTGGAITIYDRFANVVKTEISGVTARFGGGFRTGWGVVGFRGVWRHVAGAKLRVAGNRERHAIARNMVRAGFLARRGGLSFVWTSNYRSGFKSGSGAGKFKPWFGHDAVLDWKAPMGMNGARIAAGVFNIADAGLSLNTANPASVDGPAAAGWGRTFFFTLNAQW